MNSTEQDRIDHQMMRRCIELAGQARAVREFPFACVIARGDKIICESINEVARKNDVTRHAEMVAISSAQRGLGRRRMRECTLYTTVEPCPMCSTAIRETRLNRVVYALASPLMGGFSRWNVLSDPQISLAMPEYYGRTPPEIVCGMMAEEAADVWRTTYPLVWAIIQRRGCFVVPPGSVSLHKRPRTPGLWPRIVERLLPVPKG